jgi:GT2 family glycosyltransferase
MPDAADTGQWIVDSPPTGWVRVRATIQSTIPSMAALVPDRGNGFEPRARLELAAVDGPTRIDRILRLPPGLQRVRLDPICHPGQASVESFTIAPQAALAVHATALLANLRRALGSGGAGHRPSLWLGAKLLLHGDWDRFRRQMVTNAHAAAAASAYDAWQRRRALSDADRDRMRALQSTWPNPPRISVLLPVYNVEEPYLAAAIESVLRQIYPHWELCIADDASPRPHVRQVLQAYAAADRRIRLVLRARNGNISAASNSALELATGPYVALLDHDDLLAEHALHAMAAAIVADPAVDFLYSDEDKITPDGLTRSEPFFKPDWSPQYLLSCMYVSHLSVIRTDLVRRLGGFRSAFDSAQDYDLALRILSANAAVKHVPDVLYHWRSIASSAASGAAAKPQAHARAQAALADYLERARRPGGVEAGPGEGYHRIRYAIGGRPTVTAIIPATGAAIQAGRLLRNRRSWAVVRCIEALAYPALEVIVVARNPLDPALLDVLHKLPVTVVAAPPGSVDPSAAVNRAAAAATGAHLLLLNEQVEMITRDGISALLEQAQWPEIGAVGAKLISPAGTIRSVGITLLDGVPVGAFAGSPASEPGPFFAAQVVRNCSAVSAAALLTPREAFESVNGFDAARFPDQFADVDYCLRLQTTAGRRVVSMPFVTLYDHRAASDLTNAPALQCFLDRWSPRLERDPYYNPNLTNQGTDFGIR